MTTSPLNSGGGVGGGGHAFGVSVGAAVGHAGGAGQMRCRRLNGGIRRESMTSVNNRSPVIVDLHSSFWRWKRMVAPLIYKWLFGLTTTSSLSAANTAAGVPQRRKPEVVDVRALAASATIIVVV